MPRSKKRHVDKPFLIILSALLAVGSLLFLSAALSVLPKSEPQFYRMILKQFVSLALGVGILFFVSRVHFGVWKKYALPVLIGGIIVTLLVFIPGLGLEHGGARRWISLGFLSFQPAELLKIGFVVYFAAWLSWSRKRIRSPQYGLLPLGILLGVIGVVLLAQPDTGTFLVILSAGIVMYFVGGAPIKHIGVILGVGLLGAVILISMRPYLLDRIQTFANPNHDPLGSSYQVRQSLIAVGSGRLTGRGFGHSVQKFTYLPEATGDAIFAVYAEEFGFIGSILLIILYILFALRGFRIAVRAPDHFSRLLVTGIVILVVSQSFINIASIIGVFPLTGLPLIFISHGGTALLFSLFSVGVILGVSRYQRLHST